MHVPGSLFIDSNVDIRNNILKELKKFLRAPDDLGIIPDLSTFIRLIFRNPLMSVGQLLRVSVSSRVSVHTMKTTQGKANVLSLHFQYKFENYKQALVKSEKAQGNKLRIIPL